MTTEPVRASYPKRSGYADGDGARLFYEVHGEGDPPVLLIQGWGLPGAGWRAYTADLARRFRVVVYDQRGTGRSSRPCGPAAFSPEKRVSDARAVLDATGTRDAVVVGVSGGAQTAVALAAKHPDRARALVPMLSALPLTPWPPLELAWRSFEEPRQWRRLLSFLAAQPRLIALLARSRTARRSRRRVKPLDGVRMFNRAAIVGDFEEFVAWTLDKQLITDPHMTIEREHIRRWWHETGAETIADMFAGYRMTASEARELCERVECPTFVIHGERDLIAPLEWGETAAELTGGELLVVSGSGHVPGGGHPVRIGLALREFIGRFGASGGGRPPAGRADSAEPSGTGPAERRPASRRRKRAIYISSPIGLGHAQRDVAIARELRLLEPDLEIEWLAQDPVTRVLAAEGERIHPASEELASESAHVASLASGHELNAFDIWRTMDEILLHNFMVFNDVTVQERYDLWIADEGWDVDFFLHECPELKRAPYAWLSDFAGALPTGGSSREEHLLLRDVNEQLLEQVTGRPEVRDRSIFIGNPDDAIDLSLGDGLPSVAEFATEHYDFPGYVTAFDPAQLSDREALRAELGYGAAEKVCIVTVGGSGVGEALLRRVIAAYPLAKAAIPELRMIAVAGPRIDPGSLPASDGLERCAYVHNLHRHLGACDLGVVQGGLTTTMELTACHRPFLYFPLKRHFEQELHVAHRLDRYGAGRRMEYDSSPPDVIAEAIVEELGRDTGYRDVEAGGGRRAAELIAELL